MMIDQTTAITFTGISVLLVIFLNIYKFVKDQKLEAKNQGREEGSISSKIDSLLTKVDAVATQLSSLEKMSHEMNSRLVDHEVRIKKLEQKRTMGDVFE